MVDIEILKESELFEELPDQELHPIAEIAQERSYEAGHIFHREGDELDTLYFVRSGRVAVELELDLKQYLPKSAFLVERLGKGGTFGWSSLVEPHVSTATVRAEQATTAVAIDAATLRGLLTDNPRTGLAVFQALARVVGSRLRHSWAQLAGAQGLAALSDRYAYRGATTGEGSS